MRCKAGREAIEGVTRFGEGGIAGEKWSAHDCPIASRSMSKKNLLHASRWSVRKSFQAHLTAKAGRVDMCLFETIDLTLGVLKCHVFRSSYFILAYFMFPRDVGAVVQLKSGRRRV
jgi:hypothetical protein